MPQDPRCPKTGFNRAQNTANILGDFLFFLVFQYNLVGCAQTAAVLDESMSRGMGDCWDFIIGWLMDLAGADWDCWQNGRVEQLVNRLAGFLAGWLIG